MPMFALARMNENYIQSAEGKKESTCRSLNGIGIYRIWRFNMHHGRNFVMGKKMNERLWKWPVKLLQKKDGDVSFIFSPAAKICGRLLGSAQLFGPHTQL